MIVGLLKINQTLNAEDAFIDSVMAEAESIFANPDAFLTEEVVVA